jgi:hypothetical protein
MPEPTTSNKQQRQGSPAHEEPVAKDSLYGNYLKSKRKKERIFNNAAAMALDVPVDDEDVNINVNKQTGFGWKELLVLTVGLLGTAGLAAYVFGPLQTVPDSEYEVRFYDQEGNEVYVPPANPTSKDIQERIVQP